MAKAHWDWASLMSSRFLRIFAWFVDLRTFRKVKLPMLRITIEIVRRVILFIFRDLVAIPLFVVRELCVLQAIL